VDSGDVIAEVKRDKPFYDASGGGMTLSGGEPMAQLAFARALLEAAKREGVHRCMETCGVAPRSAFEAVRPLVDLFLFDVKDTSNSYHMRHTGSPLTGVLANLRYLHDHGADIRLRLPLIPGLNDRPDHFSGVAALVSTLPGLAGVEIMPYHKLGLDKDRRFGLSREACLPEESVSKALLGDWVGRLKALGVEVIN